MLTRVFLRLIAKSFACALLCAPSARAATYTTLWSFDGSDGSVPRAGMTQANGILYGTTEYGGSGTCSSVSGNGCGVVSSFDPTTNQENVVYSFAGGIADGALPHSRLTYDAKGVLYGTTYMGGSRGCENSYGSGCGTVFSINLSTGAETLVFRFGRGKPDGRYPLTAPVFLNPDSAELFGTTMDGGPAHCRCGTVYKINLRTGIETIVHSFQGYPTDGTNPAIDWTLLGGKLYSETTYGGTNGRGTVFSVDPKTDTETVVYSFGEGRDGQYPRAGMTQIGDILYGTTNGGGAYGMGTVFSFDPTKGKETILYSFKNARRNGSGPESDLIHWNGLLYGTTGYGGWHDLGVVFTVDRKTGAETTVYSWPYLSQSQGATNRLMHMNGSLYGTVPASAYHNAGTIFSLVP